MKSTNKIIASISFFGKSIIFQLLLLGIFLNAYSQSRDTIKVQLRDVEITTKHNPAIHIIKNTIKNRLENGQFSNPHFCSISYQKMFLTGDNKRDSLKHHLFFTETVTKSYFKKPALSYEKVIAHQSTGFKDPIISIYLAKLQMVNFYQSDMLDILESPFVNPISQNALAIYDFRIQEKIVSEKDTLFVISYKPKKNTHFKSLEGKLWISSENFAIAKVEASPFDKVFGLSFFLLQEYEKQQNNTWFLKQMDVTMEPTGIGVGFATDSTNVFVRPIIVSEKRITEIDYDTRLRNKDFGLVDIEEESGSKAKQNSILDIYRAVPLTEREVNTIAFFDTLLKPYKPDRVLESLKILITGNIPVYIFNFELKQILHLNSTEIARLGLGISTNKRFNKVVHLGGFFGYGFKDKEFKWGGELGFNINRARDIKVIVQYYSNLIESGGTDFCNRDYTLFSGEFYRSWLFKRFYRSNALGLTAQSRLTRWLTGYVSSFYSNNKTLYNYSFQIPFSVDNQTTFAYTDFYVRAGIRIAFMEKYWGADQYYFYSVSPLPVFIMQYSKGIKGVINSGYDYHRVDVKMLYRKNWKILGFTNITLFGGYVDRALPYPLLFNQRAGYNLVGIDGADQFSVMRPDEFLSDKYVSLFIRHNFGRMTQNKKFSPRVIVCQGIGFGTLKNSETHWGIVLKTMEKVYFESGVIIGDLLTIKGLLSFGVGAFVRYGTYYLPQPENKILDNFAFKVNIRVPFER
ncbi:MAG: DUF5686 family protein [Bacteroidales bacterium]|nr:DUF5686 family protein [Bacteroidales bacterium]